MIDSNILVCPDCHNALKIKSEVLSCLPCSKTYSFRDHIPIFVDDEYAHAVSSQPLQSLSKKCEKMRRGAKAYRILRSILNIFRPPHHSVYFDNFRSSNGEGSELKKFFKSHRGLQYIVNIGSLSKNLKFLHPNIFNLDISYYEHIDVVADAHALPFADESIDMVLLKNVIEHVRDPQKVIQEISRVLKKGGYLYIKTPFLQPFHAVPNDYQRYTTSGIAELLSLGTSEIQASYGNLYTSAANRSSVLYEKIQDGISVGPGSMLSWIIREYFAVLTSFGNKHLYALGLVFWGWLTFWIRYTDIFFRPNALSYRLASAYFGFYQKK